MNHDDDAQFWERLADMPFDEAEQECVLRREHNVLTVAMLTVEADKARAAGRRKEADEIGREIFLISSQNTALNERARYLRRVMDRITWREAVRAVLGHDAALECGLWIDRQYQAERLNFTSIKRTSP